MTDNFSPPYRVGFDVSSAYTLKHAVVAFSVRFNIFLFLCFDTSYPRYDRRRHERKEKLYIRAHAYLLYTLALTQSVRASMMACIKYISIHIYLYTYISIYTFIYIFLYMYNIQPPLNLSF